jgi:hypothetical protein
MYEYVPRQQQIFIQLKALQDNMVHLISGDFLNKVWYVRFSQEAFCILF